MPMAVRYRRAGFVTAVLPDPIGHTAPANKQKPGHHEGSPGSGSIGNEIPDAANWVGAVKPRRRGKAFSLRDSVIDLKGGQLGE